MNLPNLLTMSRIAVIPLIVTLVMMNNLTAQWIAFTLYVLAALTDYLDGYLARKLNIVSALGRMLDPIADKLIVGALLVTFAYEGSFSASLTFAAIFILMREIAVSGLREFLGPQQIIIPVSGIAKYKTTSQLLGLGLVMAVPIVPGLNLAATATMWLATGLTLYTGYEYFAGAWPYLTKEDK